MPRFDPQVFLAQAGEGLTMPTYRPGTIIFKQGEAADTVFYLRAGRAKETVMSETGKEAVIGVIKPGAFFGASGLDVGSFRVSTVTAVTCCAVTAISIRAMQAALRQPTFSEVFVTYLLQHNQRVEAEKVDLLFNSREKRLAQKLLMLAHVDEGPAAKIGPEITQEMLANMIGTTRPNVNRFLTSFRKRGLIQYDAVGGGIEVLPWLLKAVLQDDTPTIRKRGQHD